MEVKPMKAVSDELLSLLRELMHDPLLNDFYLVGGTALALHLNHRKSVDIDLFCDQGFDSQSLCSHLEYAHQASNTLHELNTVRSVIRGIKVEFLCHPYKLLEIPVNIDGIRVAGLNDLAAFKLNAVSGRGSKKDFWDVEVLLQHFTLRQMLDIFTQKYPKAELWHLIRSLTYFHDADNEQIEILDLQGRSWEGIKERIILAVRAAGLIEKV